MRNVILVGLVALLAGGTADLEAQSSPAGQTDQYFRYRVGFWNNLHHFLYVLGRAELGYRDAQREAVAGAPQDKDGFDQLNPQQQQTWRETVAFYQSDLSKRDAVFNPGWIRTTLGLVRAGDSDSLDRRVDDELAAVLQGAAPIYRQVWWDRHRAAIEQRIAEWRHLLTEHGAALTSRLSRLYQLTWPPGGVGIEVVAYANWAGAYSTGNDDGALIVMSALYDHHRGLGGIESSLHESLHQGNPVGDRVFELSKEHDLTLHDWLTHGLIFYTSGAIVQERVPGYTPMGEKVGIWDRVDSRLPTMYARHWRPYLAGETSLDEALLALLRALQD